MKMFAINILTGLKVGFTFKRSALFSKNTLSNTFVSFNEINYFYIPKWQQQKVLRMFLPP